jgi:tetratricopeptide (TPR) repeat protein
MEGHNKVPLGVWVFWSLVGLALLIALFRWATGGNIPPYIAPVAAFISALAVAASFYVARTTFERTRPDRKEQLAASQPRFSVGRKIWRSFELILFRAALWLVFLLSLGGLATKLVIGKPSTVPSHYLLVAAALAASLAVFIPAVISRISEFSVGNVKLVLARTETLGEFKASAFDDLPASGAAFEAKELKGRQLYEDERLSQKLYRLKDQLVDPRDLNRTTLHNYKQLIDCVGRAAFKMGHFTKYLETVKLFETLPEVEQTSEQRYLIGHAYLSATDEQEGADQEAYLRAASENLLRALRRNSTDVNIPFNLGLALLRRHYYEKGIKYMEKALHMHSSIADEANWNIAIGLKKLGRGTEALAKLKDIAQGPVWLEIEKDPEFVDPPDANFDRDFKVLCEDRKPKNN